MVPIPMANVSTKVSKVNDGPKVAIPRAMFSWTSFWKKIIKNNLDTKYEIQTLLEEERANCAKRVAFEKSDNKIKYGRALLQFYKFS